MIQINSASDCVRPGPLIGLGAIYYNLLLTAHPCLHRALKPCEPETPTDA